MATAIRKEDAHRLIDQLPDNATWDDLMHNIYVREVIEKGLEDSHANKTRDVEDVRRKFSLTE